MCKCWCRSSSILIVVCSTWVIGGNTVKKFRDMTSKNVRWCYAAGRPGSGSVPNGTTSICI